MTEERIKIEANGITLHLIERGSGPLVLRCHGRLYPALVARPDGSGPGR